MRSGLTSVIIVNFNAGKHLLDCVNSLLQTCAEIEIFISDNGSSDESIRLLKENFPNESRLHIVENGSNLGFSRGNNIVIPKTQGEYLLFLNPDCRVHSNALEKVKYEMDHHPNAGMASCLIRNNDGTIQPTCIRNIPTPWNSLVRIFHLNKLFPKSGLFKGLDLAGNHLPTTTVEVDGVSGAFMFVRRTALEQVGPLDEGYFLYVEDVDWMYRFQKHNWSILFVPQAEITHFKGFCGKERPIRVLWHKHRGMVRFYQKFYSNTYSLLFRWIIYLAIWTRFTLLMLLTSFKMGRNQKNNALNLHII